MKAWIQIYLLPGAVLQSVMIGGGYGTGREVVEYFTRFGVGGGLLGIAVATLAVAVIFALSLELARAYRAYDYRSFFIVLLGPFWFLYEILVLCLFMLVIAVIGAAAGTILEQELGIPSWMGVSSVLVLVVILTFYGRDLVTKVLGVWSLALYAVFISYLVTVIWQRQVPFLDGLATMTVESGWLLSSLKYVFYNVTAIPVILYAAHAIETRAQAFTAGGIGALIGVVPALLLHLSFAAAYPEILDAQLPVYALLGMVGSAVLTGAYLAVLFGTFIETGAGNIQGFVERLQTWWGERTGGEIPQVARAAIAGLAMFLAGSLSALGIVDLIASGYGTLAWGFFACYVVPLLTIGVWRIVRAGR
ncbi:MAG TPA: hypothetical protein VLA56_05705 [Pseudomonadales bacterium]|nr:hypothetical protein [Pseudomonadales bacterium]